jgi:hypothetical protein
MGQLNWAVNREIRGPRGCGWAQSVRYSIRPAGWDVYIFIHIYGVFPAYSLVSTSLPHIAMALRLFTLCPSSCVVCSNAFLRNLTLTCARICLPYLYCTSSWALLRGIIVSSAACHIAFLPSTLVSFLRLLVFAFFTPPAPSNSDRKMAVCARMQCPDGLPSVSPLRHATRDVSCQAESQISLWYGRGLVSLHSLPPCPKRTKPFVQSCVASSRVENLSLGQPRMYCGP